MNTSQAAIDSIDVTRLEGMVAEAISKAGPDGLTSDEVRALFPDLAYSSVTARFASLERRGVITRRGDTRPGKSGRKQLVMRADQFAMDFAE